MVKADSERRDAVMREMEALSGDARALIEQFRTRQKFDLTARQGWLDLQETTFSGRIAENTARETIVKLRILCVKWLDLYRELRFIASTRPFWNS